MALTDENLIASYRKKYAIDSDVVTLTVYRASGATAEQIQKDYISDDEDVLLWGTSLGSGVEEIVIGETHTLKDVDGVWTEYTGEEE
jgi:hypothetical protein